MNRSATTAPKLELAGRYSRVTPGERAEITITPTGAPNSYQIEGIAYWGENREYGPNIGALNFVARRVQNKLKYRDGHQKRGHSVLLSFPYVGVLEVDEKNQLGIHGNNVTFSGTYTFADSASPETSLISNEQKVIHPTEQAKLRLTDLFSGLPNVALTEILAALTLAYVCSIAAFNAGYFSVVRGRFDTLFTFQDLISINLPILEYFITILSLYFLLNLFFGLVWIFISEFVPSLPPSPKYWFEKFALRTYREPWLFWIIFAIGLLLIGLTGAIADAFKVSNFILTIAPPVLFQGGLLFYFWIGYKNGQVTARTILSTALIGLFFFSHASGRAWIKSEINSSDQLQALVLTDGTCLERIMLRSSNNGLLLYSLSLRQFEFRNRDAIRTIFEEKRCSP